MALSERSRTAIYQGLSTVIGDEQAVQEMMSHFPATEAEEPITKDFLRAEMSELRAELRGEMSGLRGEMSGLRQITDGIRTDLHRVALLNLGALAAFAGIIVAAVRL